MRQRAARAVSGSLHDRKKQKASRMPGMREAFGLLPLHVLDERLQMLRLRRQG